MSIAASIHFMANNPQPPAKTQAKAAAKTNVSFRELVMPDSGMPDTPDQNKLPNRNADEPHAGRTSIAGMFMVATASVPPPFRLTLSFSGQVPNDVGAGSGEPPAGAPGLNSPLPSPDGQAAQANALTALAVDIDGLSKGATPPDPTAIHPRTELAFSAVLSPMGKPAITSPAANPPMGNAASLKAAAPADGEGSFSGYSRVPPDFGLDATSRVPAATEQAQVLPSDSTLEAAPILPDTEPEPESQQPQRAETTHNPAPTTAAGRRGEAPASDNSDFDSLVKPATATSAPEDPGARPAFQFATPGVAEGAAPNKEAGVSQPHASQAPEPPQEPRPLQSATIQNLQIRVGDDPAHLVELQVSARDGNIHVAVRSSDPELTIPLRVNLPGLVESLERRGYHAESVSLGEPGPMSTMHSEPKAQGEQNGSGADGQNGGRDRDDPGSRNRRKRTSSEPATQFSLNSLQEKHP